MSACQPLFSATEKPEECPKFFARIAKTGQIGAILDHERLLDTQTVLVQPDLRESSKLLIPRESSGSDGDQQNPERPRSGDFDPPGARKLPELLAVTVALSSGKFALNNRAALALHGEFARPNEMVGLLGVEPRTPALSWQYSNQLSYSPTSCQSTAPGSAIAETEPIENVPVHAGGVQ